MNKKTNISKLREVINKEIRNILETDVSLLFTEDSESTRKLEEITTNFLEEMIDYIAAEKEEDVISKIEKILEREQDDIFNYKNKKLMEFYETIQIQAPLYAKKYLVEVDPNTLSDIEDADYDTIQTDNVYSFKYKPNLVAFSKTRSISTIFGDFIEEHTSKNIIPFLETDIMELDKISSAYDNKRFRTLLEEIFDINIEYIYDWFEDNKKKIYSFLDTSTKNKEIEKSYKMFKYHDKLKDDDDEYLYPYNF